jgi:hypothetical protein
MVFQRSRLCAGRRPNCSRARLAQGEMANSQRDHSCGEGRETRDNLRGNGEQLREQPSDVYTSSKNRHRLSDDLGI